ncbi:purine-nucleoside phosphorylase [Weeksellaceae bacterium KMM 9713]|uniref:Purine nucleoside phosphorylase n=1 Tax=Profundicola chukchiensis TaxID=2961959 RepID=A0A9X4MVT1_9FLAO|nr:purine-nucleoside phosphorylase [Profundicola chukchiensis]MDG4945788.1 purine-nucleoside phosphorylase [Profundicola chukchiensis]MDG4951527.1 purine-nucleoside phosphorylase [Profundicola chukchiensis]
MYKVFEAATDYLKAKFTEGTPEFAIVLGSGLAKLKDEIDAITKIPYQDIPDFPQTTVKGHSGELIYGRLEGKLVLLMAGRFHYYEGYTMKEVTFPFRLYHLLGIKNLIVSNASGGVNPDFKVGDIMVITDHINMFPEHPLHGPNLDKFGPRFPDMSKVYDRDYIKTFEDVAAQEDIKIHKGVYLGLQGPTFETPSEYGMIRILGADAVGMSTVPEVIVARHQGMRIAALSVITDLGGPDIAYPVSHEEVLNAANVAMPHVVKLVKGLVRA